MPGYGYAAAAKSKIAAWTALIDAYLAGRSNLTRVFVLVDARHGLKPIDEEVLGALDRAAVNSQIVLTKADAVAQKELGGRTEAVSAALARHPAAYPQVLATSARAGSGISELRAAIVRLMAEHAAI
jgi:GTP-binding protein